jgi:hypothetical protein
VASPRAGSQISEGKAKAPDKNPKASPILAKKSTKCPYCKAWTVIGVDYVFCDPKPGKTRIYAHWDCRQKKIAEAQSKVPVQPVDTPAVPPPAAQTAQTRGYNPMGHFKVQPVPTSSTPAPKAHKPVRPPAPPAPQEEEFENLEEEEDFSPAPSTTPQEKPFHPAPPWDDEIEPVFIRPGFGHVPMAQEPVISPARPEQPVEASSSVPVPSGTQTSRKAASGPPAPRPPPCGAPAHGSAEGGPMGWCSYPV